MRLRAAQRGLSDLGIKTPKSRKGHFTLKTYFAEKYVRLALRSAGVRSSESRYAPVVFKASGRTLAIRVLLLFNNAMLALLAASCALSPSSYSVTSELAAIYVRRVLL